MKRNVVVAEEMAVSCANFNNEGESQVNEQSKGNAYLTVDLNARTEETISANETSLEKKERTYRCVHGNVRVLCVTCAGLSESDLKRWNRVRTRARHIKRCGTRLVSYSYTRIAESDCVLVSSPEIADCYECCYCQDIIEWDDLKSLKTCPSCGEPVQLSDEFFQPTQFSPAIGTGTKAVTHIRNSFSGAGSGESSVRDLYTDPNSRFQKGGTGHIRLPLDATRETRANPPEWLPNRELFLKTLRCRRALRAERILSGFYLNEERDTQIAAAIGWTKDAVKKERKTLIQTGDDFFRLGLEECPPCPAIFEGARTTKRHLTES